VARFRWIGEPVRPSLVASYGPCIGIRVPRKDGTLVTIMAADRAKGFATGEEMDYDFTDVRSLRAMRADARFVEVGVPAARMLPDGGKLSDPSVEE
jgi:hypothetical protein